MGKKDVPLPPGTTRAVGTNGEVLFDGQFVTIKHGWTAPGGRGESKYPIGAVTGAEVKPGFITAIFTLVVSGGVQRSDGKNNRKGDPLSAEGGKSHLPGFQQMRDRILQAVAARDQRPAPAAPAAGSPDLAGQIQQLAALHAQGVLTAEEFAAAKGRLIGGLGAPQDAVPRQW